MRFERLAGRVQVAEVLKAKARHVSLIASAKGRHPQVFSRAGSESELHFKSLLWSPWTTAGRRTNYCKPPDEREWGLGSGGSIREEDGLKRYKEAIPPCLSDLRTMQFQKDRRGRTPVPVWVTGPGASCQGRGTGEEQVRGRSGQGFCLGHCEFCLLDFQVEMSSSMLDNI